jgi:hypothetical protein
VTCCDGAAAQPHRNRSPTSTPHQELRPTPDTYHLRRSQDNCARHPHTGQREVVCAARRVHGAEVLNLPREVLKVHRLEE